MTLNSRSDLLIGAGGIFAIFVGIGLLTVSVMGLFGLFWGLLVLGILLIIVGILMANA